MEKFNNIIDILASDDYYKAKQLINALDNRDAFIKTIISINNPYIFDRFCKMFEYDIDTSIYYQERNKMIKKTLLDNKKILSDSWLNEYIISYFFQDNYYNYMINLYQMVGYLGRVNKNLIDKDHLNIYQKFCNLKKMSWENKINLFKLYMDRNLLEMFYDDIRKIKNDSYQELVSKSIKLDHNLSIYQENISKENDIDIYYLDGEEFNGFVRCFDINRDDLADHYDYLFSNDDRLGYSFSYISDKNIGTIDYEQKKVVLLYDDIDYNKIMYVHHGDLHSKKMGVQNDYLSEKINEIHTPNSLISSTKNYNEIYIVGKTKPKALVCYDEITSNDLAFAKKYHLSILYINKDKYKRYETYDDDYKDSTYII